MTDSKGKEKQIIRLPEFTTDGAVSAELVSNERLNIGGVVSSTNVQQSKNQIPKPKGSQ